MSANWKGAVAPPLPAPSVRAPSTADPKMLKRARAYVATMPPAISGSGGHDATWNVARKLVADVGLSEGDALNVLIENYNPRCQPPWSERELAHKVRDAINNARVSNPLEDRKPVLATRTRAERPKAEAWEPPTPPPFDDDYEPKDHDAPPGLDADKENFTLLYGDGGAQGDSDNEPGNQRQGADAPQSGDKPAIPSELESRWIWIGDCPDALIKAPPPQNWLLSRWKDGRDVGVFPRGKTGLLVGAGGVSKTNLATQWAVAVAQGGFLLETFKVTEPGHVLLALAEEERDEVMRRLYRTCNMLELSADERKDIAQRVHVLPLHGVPVAMLQSPALNVYLATEIATNLHKAMEARAVDWSLLILDPLSRWSGGGAERDNEAATRFVQVVEGLTKVRGNPAGLLVHHSSQASIAAGISAPRGVTGLHDGFRWVANMDVQKTKDGARAVKLHNSKSNYSPEFDDMLLVRNSDPGIEGTLRKATAFECEAFGFNEGDRTKAREAKTRDEFSVDCEAVLALIPDAPAHIASGALDAALRSIGKVYGDKKLTKLLQHLAGSVGGKLITDLSNGAQCKPRQWARTSGGQ
jgi:AAA domain